MARRRRGKPGLRSFIVLVIVTVISGFALQQTGNLGNPFEFSRLLMSTPPLEEDSGFQMIQLDDTGAETDTDMETFTPPERMPEGGDMPEQSYSLSDYFDFSWNDIGNVFYNAWVFLVLTIAVIVFARPIGWAVKRFKQATNNQTKAYSAQ